MSAGGLRAISESPVDSSRDSDQFSLKVNSNEKVKSGKFYYNEMPASLCFLSGRCAHGGKRR